MIVSPAASSPSPPQHLRALESANRVRLARAELKRRIAGGHVAVAEVVTERPWAAAGMPVLDLLMSQRRWGATRSRKLLTRIPLSETRKVGALTDRERDVLAQELEPSSTRERVLVGS